MSANETFALALFDLAGLCAGIALTTNGRPHVENIDQIEQRGSSGERALIAAAWDAWRGVGFVGVLGSIDAGRRDQVVRALVDAYGVPVPVQPAIDWVMDHCGTANGYALARHFGMVAP